MAENISKYEIISFAGGISDFCDRGIRGAFRMGRNLDIRRPVDSLTSGQALVDEGLHTSRSPSSSISPSVSVSSSISSSISPSPSPSTGPSPSSSVSPSPSSTASPSQTPSSSVSPSPSAGISTIFSDLIRFFIKSSDGFLYAFGHTGQVYRRDSSSYWANLCKLSFLPRGAAEMTNRRGERYMYVAGPTALYRKRMPGASNWSDISSFGALDDYPWHTMKEVGGAIFICNGPHLAMVGYDGSYTNEALDLVPGNLSKTIVERNGRAIIGTYRDADATKSVNAAIDTEVPLAQVGENGEIYFANMTDSIAVKTFPGGGKCNVQGVCNNMDAISFFEWEQDALSWIDKQEVGNLAMFGVYNADTNYGGIYSYGRLNKNNPFVLNLDYHLDVDEIGALINFDGTLLASYREGTEYGVKAVDPSTKATGTYEGLEFRAPSKLPINITEWKYAEIMLSPLPDGASIELFYKLDRNGDFIRARTAQNGLSFNTANGTKAVFSISALGEIFEPRIVLNPTFNVSPEIHRITIFFS